MRTPDNAAITTGYFSNTVTVTDQAGKSRRSVTNALGQLVRVDEPNAAGQLGTVTSPNQPTSYAYDTLNNLTTVSQGVQTRTFVYNSLSRLLSATNPESGTISYGYDSNGNLTTKTDARGVKTDYVYDALSRVTNRSYSTPSGTPPNYQATPNVTYTYDDPLITNSKGKLTKVSSSVSETKYTGFDIVGRVLSSQQITDGQTYGSSCTYNLSGALIEQTYPSGRLVKKSLDSDGKLQQVQSRKANDTLRNYANTFTYNAAGAVTSMRLGNGLWETTQFNNRLQPTQIGLGSGAATQNKLKLDYEYGATASVNNGNVTKQSITVPGLANPFVQTYTYDSQNRITSAEERSNSTTTWKQTYTFDRYGNRNFNESLTTTLPKNCGTSPNYTVCTAAVPVVNPSVSTSNNRLNGTTYDASGNVVVDAEGREFTYDAENKQIQAENSSSTILGTYYFDGEGKRVKKVVPSTGETTVFVYDAAAKLIGEYSTIVAASQNAKIQYLTTDNLGTPRVNTDAIGNVVSRSDYMPYGEEIISLAGRSGINKYVADDVRQGFTGYESDDETGLEFAQARMYLSQLARFTSPDPLLSSGRSSSPQTWNRYAYVLNQPLSLIDPDGLYECRGLTDQCKELRQTLSGARAQLESIKTGYGIKSNEYKRAKRSLDAYGCESVKGNCVDSSGKEVTVKGKPVKDTSKLAVEFTRQDNGARVSYDPSTNGALLSLSSTFSSKNPYNQGVIANEGSGAKYQVDLANKVYDPPGGKYEIEFDGALVQAVVNEAYEKSQGGFSYSVQINPVQGPSREIEMWNEGWETPDKAIVRANRTANINTFLREDKDYLLSPPARPAPPRKKK